MTKVIVNENNTGVRELKRGDLVKSTASGNIVLVNVVDEFYIQGIIIVKGEKDSDSTLELGSYAVGMNKLNFVLFEGSITLVSSK